MLLFPDAASRVQSRLPNGLLELSVQECQAFFMLLRMFEPGDTLTPLRIASYAYILRTKFQQVRLVFLSLVRAWPTKELHLLCRRILGWCPMSSPFR